MSSIRAVLFDVGGPLDTEVVYERLADEQMRDALRAERIFIGSGTFTAASRRAVETFAPNACAAIVWRLCLGDADTAARVWARFVAGASGRHAVRAGFELRPGIDGLLARLHGRGVLLGLAANQPADAIERMRSAGIARYFHAQGVSGTHGLRKPDARLFLRACDDLGVAPEACVMVGDRIDNDIAPARALGMRTVLFRTGRHRGQQPRSWEEVPDVEVASVEELDAALAAMLGAQ